MNNTYLEEWLEQTKRAPEKLEGIFTNLTEEELNHKPSATCWSIGELVDHIMVTNSLYLPKYRKIIEGNHRNPFSSRFKYVTNFLGKSILHSVDPDNKKKLKTVKKFEPHNKQFKLDQIVKFQKLNEELIDLVVKTDHVNHQKTYIVSPASPLIVYSLEYANKIILWHGLRHIQQAGDVLNKHVEKV